jgi:hypothetical protein
MLLKIFNFFFGCRHRERTTPRLDLNKGFYEACLSCGKELPYVNPVLLP